MERIYMKGFWGAEESILPDRCSRSHSSTCGHSVSLPQNFWLPGHSIFSTQTPYLKSVWQTVTSVSYLAQDEGGKICIGFQTAPAITSEIAHLWIIWAPFYVRSSLGTESTFCGSSLWAVWWWFLFNTVSFVLYCSGLLDISSTLLILFIFFLRISRYMGSKRDANFCLLNQFYLELL